MVRINEEEFVKDNLGLVHSCCKRFAGRGIEYDDLFQAGSMGLLKAARDFDESRGFMFSTYAVPVILGEVKRLFRDTGAIKVSRSLKELSLKVNAASQRFEKLNGYPPTVFKLSEMLDRSPEEITEAISASQAVVSLTYNNDEGDTQMDIPVVDESENIASRLLVSQALDSLSVADRQLIVMRYFCSYTQTQVAKRLNLTQVQVSRREQKLLKELRKTLSS